MRIRLGRKPPEKKAKDLSYLRGWLKVGLALGKDKVDESEVRKTATKARSNRKRKLGGGQGHARRDVPSQQEDRRASEPPSYNEGDVSFIEETFSMIPDFNKGAKKDE